MSKLPTHRQFIDLSDYGRPLSRWIVQRIKGTRLTPIHVTLGFILSGLLAIFCFYQSYYWAASFFLIMKSVLDAADGELARVKNTPSYTGRYLDSIADIILNFLFIASICHITDGSWVMAGIAFIGIQLQGTLYNYYYVILRNKYNGDTTSRVFEDKTPVALAGEKQSHVDIMYHIYNTLYISFDKSIYWLDRSAIRGEYFPKWYMSVISCFGLGFQLLIMAIMIPLGLIHYVIPFFVFFSTFIFVFIGLRRYMNARHIES